MSERKDWRVVKVTYIQEKMTLREARSLKRRLNNERVKVKGIQFYYKAEKMEAY